jgi:hypothetical protein
VSDRLLIPDNRTWGFCAMITAHSTTVSQSGCWEIRGVLRKDNSSATLRLLNVNKTTIAKEDPVWDVNVTMDTYNGVMRFQVKGSAETIRWHAKLMTVEVGG